MNELTPTPLAKPVVKKAHFHVMNLYDIATLTDLSAYPGLTLGAMLTLPTSYVIGYWGIT